jgi:hypothetical protein
VSGFPAQLIWSGNIDLVKGTKGDQTALDPGFSAWGEHWKNAVLSPLALEGGSENSRGLRRVQGVTRHMRMSDEMN